MFRRKVQQSAAAGVARVEFGSRLGFKRADGEPASRRDLPENTEEWNAQGGGVAGRHPQDFDAALPGGTTYSQDDYCGLLTQAMAGLDRDSYATRGAVYDRECKSLMRKLYSTAPPLSDAEIDAELRAFRNAVRTVEFGLDEQDVLMAPEDGGASGPDHEHLDRNGGFPKGHGDPRDGRGDFQPVPEVGSPIAPPHDDRNWSNGRSGEVSRRELRDPPPWARRQPAQAVPSEQIESALEAALDLGPAQARPGGQVARAKVELADAGDSGSSPKKRQSVLRRIVYRALLAVAVLAAGTAGYGLLTDNIDLPFLKGMTGGSLTSKFSGSAGSQQVLLFDGSRPDLNGTKFEGTANWRLLAENPRVDSSPAIQLDLEVPGRRIAVTMVIRREPAGSSMSHIFEFRFLGEDRKPDPDISNIAGIVMTSADMSRPNSLAGHVVNVTPGVFMFGLSGLPNDREQNLRKLSEFPWVGIPITYRNGAAGVLTFEKGDAGNRVFEEALNRWARTP